jgi:hypothetical protein
MFDTGDNKFHIVSILEIARVLELGFKQMKGKKGELRVI